MGLLHVTQEKMSFTLHIFLEFFLITTLSKQLWTPAYQRLYTKVCLWEKKEASDHQKQPTHFFNKE